MTTSTTLAEDRVREFAETVARLAEFADDAPMLVGEDDKLAFFFRADVKLVLAALQSERLRAEEVESLWPAWALKIKATLEDYGVEFDDDEIDLPTSFDEWCVGFEEACKREIQALTLERDAMREGLGPFLAFAQDNTEADVASPGHGIWSGNRCEKDRIRDWFGPTDFYRLIPSRGEDQGESQVSPEAARRSSQKLNDYISRAMRQEDPCPMRPEGQGDLEGAWLRSENLLYTLAQQGWRKGEPVMVNRFMVHVSYDGRHAGDDEFEALISYLHKALNGLNSTGEG